jgi:hypothetical protein
MSIVVFCGPTLSAATGRTILPTATFVAPAMLGDVYAAVRRGVGIIALCDGYFEHQLSVWHKEILWALAHGIRVYGASSMGALRAAELASFGMVGVGKIFEQFHDGRLEDDDEVAVIHEPAERGFAVRSEAMVNIRATLERAVTLGIICHETSGRMIALAKRAFYADRAYDALLGWGAAAGVAASELERLDGWLRTHGPVDQKHVDAIAMLHRIDDDVARGPAAAGEQPRFHFEYTDAWHALRVELDGRDSRHTAPRASSTAWRASIAQRNEEFDVTCCEAVERALALALAEAEDFTPDVDAIQTWSEEFRRERSLYSPEETSAWLPRNGLDINGFSALAHRELMIEHSLPKARDLANQQLAALRVLRKPRT